MEENDYHIWGSSHYFLFTARWPVQSKFDPGWRTHSEIALYKSNVPEGSYKFIKVLVQQTGRKTWDKTSAHNPTIHKINDIFALFYVSNSGIEDHPRSQSIGLRLAKIRHSCIIKISFIFISKFKVKENCEL